MRQPEKRVMSAQDIKELQQRRQRERQKCNRFRLTKQQLYTCITRFCTLNFVLVTARLRHENAYFHAL